MEEAKGVWTYFATFGSLVAAGFGAPIPEELPVVAGGALAGVAANQQPREHPYWWILWPLCIAGVVLADAVLYLIGRYGGRRLLKHNWVRKHLVKPEKQQQIEENFRKYGVRILLGARFLPGIRAPIFFMSGVLHMPLPRFLLADGLYAIPGVTILFFLSFWFADTFVTIFHAVEDKVRVVQHLLVIAIIAAAAGYFIYAYNRRKVATGDPHEVPLIGGVKILTDEQPSTPTEARPVVPVDGPEPNP